MDIYSQIYYMWEIFVNKRDYDCYSIERGGMLPYQRTMKLIALRISAALPLNDTTVFLSWYSGLELKEAVDLDKIANYKSHELEEVAAAILNQQHSTLIAATIYSHWCTLLWRRLWVGGGSDRHLESAALYAQCRN